ncbi:hypothetical protein F5B20DRAFT_121775 [Whalleya microplaca]|nr:hypothetical protein F5B20DRAFT_121775 [Whalleya microplaca]
MLMDGDQDKHVLPMSIILIQPCVGDFRTLLAIWRRLLPFNIHMPIKGPVLSLNTISGVQIHFTVDDRLELANVPVFRNAGLNGESPSIRGVGMVRVGYPPLREVIHEAERAYVISVLKWKTETATASLWFSETTILDVLSPSGIINRLYLKGHFEVLMVKRSGQLPR